MFVFYYFFYYLFYFFQFYKQSVTYQLCAVLKECNAALDKKILYDCACKIDIKTLHIHQDLFSFYLSKNSNDESPFTIL